MVARILGADVVLTEQNKLVRLMNENIARNFGVGGSPAIGIRAFPLNWSEEGARAVIAECCDNSRGFDLVLSCDCVYAPLYGDSWRQLITCLRILLCIGPAAKRKTQLSVEKVEKVEKTDLKKKKKKKKHGSVF